MIRPLSIVWNFDPVFFSIGSLDIRYYGLMWALAILIGAKFFDNFCKREGLPPKVSESIFIYGTLATIIGARLGHCLFYDPMEYLSKPWTIITGFRDGGMASHGAAIGLLIGLWLFSRKNKLPYIWSLDRIMIAVGIGGAVVRLGNLFNSEIFGMATTLPWGFEFVRSAKWVNEFAPAAVHPTQIYEALCYLITFGILCWLYYAKDIARRRPGILFGIGLLGIFLTRFFIEFIKTEQEAFEQGWVLDMGQWLSIPFIVLGIYMIYRGLSEPEVTPAPVPPVTMPPATVVPTQPTPAPVAPAQTVAPTNPAPAVPVTTAPTYTLDQIAKAGASLVDAGKMEQLLALLAKYGVQAVTQLQPDQYGVFATELRTLGAQL